MKKILLFFFLSVIAATAAVAGELTFDANTKYRIECKKFGNGSIVLGENHGSTAYLYYAVGITEAEDAWWYIRSEGEGYAIINAKSGEYLTYSSQRIQGVAKGIILTQSSNGSKSQWTFSEQNGYAVIYNVSQPTHCFNVRTDGTYLVGTYEGYGDENELFTLYNEKGEKVNGTGGNSGGDVTVDDFTQEKGKTSTGEYWECTGIEQPVVYTTDTNNPVLYSILNLRQQKYVYESDAMLAETDYAGSRTKFYFVQKGEGVQIYTQAGNYVETSYPNYYEQWGLGVTTSSGNTQANLWGINWEGAETTPGYSLHKLDHLFDEDDASLKEQSEYNYWNDYNGDHIGLYDMDAGSTFIFASSDSRHIDNLKEQGITFDGTGGQTTTVSFKTALDSLRLGGKELIYDEWGKQYLLPLSTTLQQGGTLTASLTCKPKAGYEGYSVTLEDQSSTQPAITLNNPNCQTNYTLKLINAAGEEQDKATLRFTYLPVVEVNVSSVNGYYYNTGTIRVTDADGEGYDSTFIAAFKYRGATAQNMSKKAYAVKLRDETGASVDRSFLGLREDNNWILDAMAVDPACMRNRVSTDLWNDFSTPPYYKGEEKKAMTGTRGKFVEMLLNGRYNGIYCMTEKLDRKQLKLKKYKSAADSKDGQEQIRGLLYKSTSWSYEVFMGHESDMKYFPRTAPSSYKNQLGQEEWCCFEQKYPDYETEAVDWQPLWNAINFVATSDQTKFDAQVKDYFDYPVLKDYYLFIELMLATDNHGKNMFYFVYDKTGDTPQKLGIAPWDLDGTWGIRWDGSTTVTSPEQDFDSFLWEREHGELTTYYKLMQSQTIPWAEELAERYAELRQTFFNEAALKQRFQSYADLFAASNADEREQKRWKGYTFYKATHSDLQGAATYIEDWISQRLAALDEKYGYDASTSSVNQAKSESYFSATGGSRAICLVTGEARTASIYTLSGTLIRTVRLQAGQNILTGFAPGVYVVNGQKVIVRP